MNPVVNAPLDTTCDGRNWFGWQCGEELAKSRLAYLAAKNGDERKKRLTRSACGSSNRRPTPAPGSISSRSPTAKTKRKVGLGGRYSGTSISLLSGQRSLARILPFPAGLLTR